MSESFGGDDLLEVARVSKSQDGGKPDIEVDEGADGDDTVEDNLVPVVTPHEVGLMMIIIMMMMMMMETLTMMIPMMMIIMMISTMMMMMIMIMMTLTVMMPYSGPARSVCSPQCHPPENRK